MKMTIKNELIKSQKFSVIADMWSQPGLSFSYLGVTVQYYSNKEKQIKTAALACRSLPHPHTATRIRDAVNEVLGEWGLDESKVLRYVTDQGANIVAALKCHTMNQDQYKSDSDEDDFEQPQDDLMEYLNYDNTEIRRTFPKRLSCFAHVLNCVSHSVLDKNGGPIQPLKDKVLSLVYKFSKSGVATQQLQNLSGKKLLKVAKTRWNLFYYVIDRLLELQKSVETVCSERSWQITFNWADVVLCRDLLKPIAETTTLLEGDTVTSSEILPRILTLNEHFEDQNKKFGRFGNTTINLLYELNCRFGHIFDPNSPNFDPTALVCCMLDPSKSTELTEELFAYGKVEVQKFVTTKFMLDEIEDLNEPVSSSTPPHDEAPQQPKRRRLLPVACGPRQSIMQVMQQQCSEYLRVIEVGAFDTDTDAINFWHKHLTTFDKLSIIAFMVLAIPATSASAERLFSHAGITAGGRRCNIRPNLLEAESLARYNRRFINV